MEKSCGCIVFNNGKVLVEESISGFYGFPKGHIENGESEEECAIRETKEECNLDVSGIKILTACDDVAPDRHFVTITTIANSYSGEIKIMEPEKEDEWKWFDIDDLPSNLYPPSINSLNYFKENR